MQSAKMKDFVVKLWSVSNSFRTIFKTEHQKYRTVINLALVLLYNIMWLVINYTPRGV